MPESPATSLVRGATSADQRDGKSKRPQWTDVPPPSRTQNACGTDNGYLVPADEVPPLPCYFLSALLRALRASLLPAGTLIRFLYYHQADRR